MSIYQQPAPDKTFLKLWSSVRIDLIIALNQFQDPPNPQLYRSLIRNMISIDHTITKNIVAMSQPPIN
jgi:hypothetical protein